MPLLDFCARKQDGALAIFLFVEIWGKFAKLLNRKCPWWSYSIGRSASHLSRYALGPRTDQIALQDGAIANFFSWSRGLSLPHFWNRWNCSSASGTSDVGNTAFQLFFDAQNLYGCTVVFLDNYFQSLFHLSSSHWDRLDLFVCPWLWARAVVA